MFTKAHSRFYPFLNKKNVFCMVILLYRVGNVLYLKTERESSSYFNLIKAASEGENTFVLAGDGTLRMYKVRELLL